MRPEGFKNPYKECIECKFESDTCGMDYCEGDKAEFKAFEAGADAYEEGLWKMAKESPTGIFTFDTHEINVPSVFTRRLMYKIVDGKGNYWTWRRCKGWNWYPYH